MKASVLILLLISSGWVHAQEKHGQLRNFIASDSVLVTIDEPDRFYKNKPTIITFYALPNGNTTAQTMGKKMSPGDDWHYDIQHIKAQTAFIRTQLGKKKNFVVIYLDNNLKSWPAWKRTHPEFKTLIPALVDSLTGIVPGKRKQVFLNGHSGGGSFIFGYIAGVTSIPKHIRRISFLDSDYGYDSSYYPAFRDWLRNVKGAALNVFAYNDSVALLNGKSFVSATGGTWWRSKLFLNHLQVDFQINKIRDDSLIIYQSGLGNIQFFLKTNPERKIFHTTQVELNGFIHSILCGTAWDSKNYQYYGPRVYDRFIE